MRGTFGIVFEEKEEVIFWKFTNYFPDLSDSEPNALKKLSLFQNQLKQDIWKVLEAAAINHINMFS